MRQRAELPPLYQPTAPRRIWKTEFKQNRIRRTKDGIDIFVFAQ
jgi:hypothetical protein